MQVGRRIVQACRLCLGKCGRRTECRDLARTVSAIVSKAEDRYGICLSIGIYLERNRTSLVYADIGCESLNGGVSHSRDRPLAGVVSGFGIFADDVVCHCGTATKCLGVG